MPRHGLSYPRTGFRELAGGMKKKEKTRHALGDHALQHRQRVSAREAYLRASNYYRTAEFFLHGNPEDPRLLSTWGNSRTSFRQAVQLMDTPVEEVLIPY